MSSKILFRGAEATISLHNGDTIFKDRIEKSYRLNELDKKLRKRRTKSETKILEKASKIVNVPKLIPNNQNDDFRISMEFINGKKLSENLDKFNDGKQLEIFREIGENVAKLHNSDIIHGDLTTSNMILNEKENKVYFIDFGLGFISAKMEDRAVDIHLLKQALESKHFNNWEKIFESFFKGYKISKDYNKTLERFKKVEARGRYKAQY